MLLPPDDVRNVHRLIVDDYGKVIRWIAVGFEDDEIIHLLRIDRDFAAHLVAHKNRLVIRQLETNNIRTPFVQIRLDRRLIELQRRPIVAIVVLLTLCIAARRVQFLRRLKGAIGLAFIDKLVNVLVIDIQSFGAEIRAEVTAAYAIELRPFIPVDAKPAQIMHQRLAGGVR